MHESHTRHRQYRMTCDQFEEVVARGKNCCEICGIEAALTWRKKLVIDHDASFGIWAVRGLICPPCNTAIGPGTPHNDRAAEYLATPWFMPMAAAAGFPGGVRAEPPDGTRIRDCIRGTWERPDQQWHPLKGYYKAPETWDWLIRMFGPHRIQLIDEHL